MCNDLHIEPARDEMILFLLRHGHCLFVFYYSLFWYFLSRRVCVFIFVILLSFIHI